MKEKFLIFSALFVLIIILIGLNAASYVQKEEIPDNELQPNRSTYNVGSTGTRAFYDLLSETGRPVTRWQEPPSALLRNEENTPATFVVIGKTLRDFEETEIEHLQQWVAGGGRLILIDREPLEALTTTSANWSISVERGEQPSMTVDPSNQTQMTNSAEAVKPVQPSLFTENVVAVQPSRFASSIGIAKLSGKDSLSTTGGINTSALPVISQPAPAPAATIEDYEDSGEEVEPPPPPAASSAPGSENQTDGGNETESSGEDSEITIPETNSEDVFASPTPVDIEPMITPTPEIVRETGQISAPLIHLANKDKNLLVEFAYGDGEIILLTDPFIVSNSGINLVDNAQIGINLVASKAGITAFDEYHQGYGKNNNPLLAYFEGTPVVAFLLQIIALIALVFYTKSRRFARALPDGEPNRLSKLEYVAAMAQLQQRTKAYDLAVENIYRDFRRRASRLVGADNFTISRADLAKLVAERIELKADEIDRIMFKCEEIIYGEPTDKKEVIDLISRLREIETELGLRRGRNAIK